MADVTIDEVMKAYADDAVVNAAKRQVNLDYSERSLEAVDQLLGMESYIGKTPRVPTGPDDEETLWMLSKMMGAYVGEVTIRLFEGRWIADDLPEGGTIAAIDIQGLMGFPLQKVWKRLTESEYDGVAGYCRGLRAILSKRKH